MITFSLATLPDAAYVGRIRYAAGWQNARGNPQRPSLYYIYSGMMHFTVGEKELFLPAGTAVLLTEGYPYRVRAEEDCDYCYFQFDMPTSAQEDLHFEKRKGRRLPARPAALSLPLAAVIVPQREQMEHLAGVALRHAEGAQGFDKVRLDVALYRMLLLLGEATANNTPEGTSTRGKRTYLALREYIEQHYAEEISLSAVSARMGISAQYAARVFRQYEACSITAFITQVRLKRSEELLQYTPLSIAEIAFAVGFSSPYYYTRQFTHAYGVSPVAFRRMAIEEV